MDQGHWVNRRLIKVYPPIFIAIWTGFFIYRFAFADGLLDPWGVPVGSDYSLSRAASLLILEGRPEAPYDMATFVGVLHQMLPGFDEVGPWTYPPTYHFFIQPLSLLPYVPAYVIWLLVTFVPLAAILWRIAPRKETLWLLAAFPGTFMNLAHGHNGFLTAALMGGGLMLLTRKPVLAGILFGLLTFKPHLGVLIPLGLICGRQWTAFLWAAATTVLFAALSVGVFGMETWAAFFDGLTNAGTTLSGDFSPIRKMPSLFATLIGLGVGKTAAYGAHAVLALLVAGAVARVWWKRRPTASAIAVLATGTLFVSPHLYEYDLTILAVPIALVAWEGISTGWLRWEREVLVLGWLTPLIVIFSGTVLGVQLGTVCLLAVFAVTLRRALWTEEAGEDGKRPAAGAGIGLKNPGKQRVSGRFD